MPRTARDNAIAIIRWLKSNGVNEETIVPFALFRKAVLVCVGKGSKLPAEYQRYMTEIEILSPVENGNLQVNFDRAYDAMV